MPMDRRRFAGVALAGLGACALGSSSAAEDPPPLLPTVRWGKHDITRLLVGHNPIKGVSHFSDALSREMREYFADPRRGVQLLCRCQELGINCCQMGIRPSEPPVEELLRAHRGQGGTLEWIATFYSSPKDRESAQRELAGILRLEPRPIGIQQFGNTSDLLMREGKIELALENLKRLRDAGVLVGLGSHNHEVIDCAEDKGWDVDFYQCSFYRSWFGLDAQRRGDRFDEEARQSMAQTIRRVAKPCIAFKVLGASRLCQSPGGVEAALRFAFENIKPNDVVLLGMWQKHKDQVAENTAIVRKILSVRPTVTPLSHGERGRGGGQDALEVPE